MARHGLSLLAGESTKPKAKTLMEAISGGKWVDVVSRRPWLDEPNCLGCHKGFGPPSIPDNPPIQKDDLYREKVDEAGVPCMACHGPTHALYPAKNPYDPKRDNIQPLQYTGKELALGSRGTCTVCHTSEMEESFHHPNMIKSAPN
jgi:hypothetical protein